MNDLPKVKIEEKITVSYLLTKEDYGEYCTAAVNHGITRQEKFSIRGLGLLAVLCGCIFTCFPQIREKGSNFIWMAVLELIGLLMLIWYDWILPTYVWVSACSYMDRHREKLTSRNFIFTPCDFSYTCGGCRMKIPYEKLYHILEKEKVWVFWLGAEESLFMPKRALSEEENNTLREWMKNARNKEEINM